MSNNEIYTPSFANENTPESNEEKRELISRAMGKYVVFRVMNLERHDGVQSRKEDGTVTYTVKNQQYPEQGDFAFGGGTGFQDAATRAYPRNLHNVYAIQVDPEHVVEPYPDDAPGLVYIKNGATVTARIVPKHSIDNYVRSPSSAPSDLSKKVAAEAFPLSISE